MAIMAVMSILGILAMVGINNGVIADKAAEQILSQIREAQNKAFSVASVEVEEEGTIRTVYPVAWGVKIAANTTTSFYVLDGGSGSSFDYREVSGDNDRVNYTIKSITGVVGGNSIYYTYASPFGKFVAQTGNLEHPCKTNGVNICSLRSDLPKNLEVDIRDSVMTTKTTTQIDFRGSTRSITVEPNGEASISE